VANIRQRISKNGKISYHVQVAALEQHFLGCESDLCHEQPGVNTFSA